MYELPYVKTINHIALCWQIFVFYFVHSFYFFLFLFVALLCAKKEWTSAIVHIGIHQAKNCLDKKENIAQNLENCVTEGKGNWEKERRETNREKYVGKEETRRSDSEGVRRKRKSKRKRKSERAIRVMCCARERLFSNISFLENNL